MYLSSPDLASLLQVLEEMERELGFSYRSALPPEERQHYQRKVLELHKHNSNLRSALQNRQQELGLSDSALHELEDEKKKLQEKVCVCVCLCGGEC